MAGRLRLRGQVLLRIGRGAENAHQLALRSRKSYPAVARYINDDVRVLDLVVLPHILLDGQELAVEQMMNLKLSDLFEYVPDR